MRRRTILLRRERRLRLYRLARQTPGQRSELPQWKHLVGVTFAPRNRSDVGYFSRGTHYYIGPTDGGKVSGTLVITLASAASAVGIGEMKPAQISLFDRHENDVGDCSTSAPFALIGLVASDGADIQTIDLSGAPFADFDFRYASATAPVPEPAAWRCLRLEPSVSGSFVTVRAI